MGFDLINSVASQQLCNPLAAIMEHVNVCIKKRMRERENELTHRMLRALHSHRYEYVWSDALQAHVRIGESLKEQSRIMDDPGKDN